MSGFVRSGEGGLRLTMEPCPLCKKAHTTPLQTLEQKVKIDGKNFVHWTKCETSGDIILTRPRTQGGIGIAFAHPPKV